MQSRTAIPGGTALTHGELDDDLARLAQAARSVLGQESRLRVLFEHSPVGTALLDGNGRIVEVNEALCRFLGRRRTDLTGERLLDYAHPEEGRYLGPGRSERRFVHRDGRAVWAVMSAVSVRDGDALPDGSLIVCVDDATSRHDQETQLRHAAMHDSLTNLPNRRLLRDRLDTALARADRSETTMAVLFVDLDDFKAVNDTLGHDAGDEMLVAVARNIIAALRTCDTVARLGGDEFVVVCEDVTGEGDIARLAQRIADAVHQPVVMRGRRLAITASIGVAVPGSLCRTSEDLLRHADLAMFRAKRRSDTTYVVADDGAALTGSSPLPESGVLPSELRHAIQTGELTLHYQPVVRHDGLLLGLEALLRWPHQRLGLLRPRDFFHCVEGTDLAKPLSDWVLRAAIADAGVWKEKSLRICVNVWAEEVARNGFAETVSTLLAWADVPPSLLFLEMREREMDDLGPALSDSLDRLHRLGVGLVVDGFGTDGISLTNLRRFPVDTVKTDHSFAHAVVDDAAQAAITAGIAAATKAAGRRPVAAGVETPAQLRRLRELGFEFVQGHLSGRPAPIEDLRHVIAVRRVELDLG